MTITYSAPTATSTPAPATSVDAPAAESPLGFLAALIDQMLANTAEAIPAPTAAPGGTPDVDLSALLNLNATTSETPSVPAPALNTLADLTDALAELDKALQAGTPPDPDLLDRLSKAADALAALFAPPATPAGAILPIDTSLDPLAAIAAAGQPATPTPAPSAPAEAEPPTLPALANLATRLGDLATKLEAQIPGLADKLTAIAATVTAVESSPELTARLAAAGNLTPTALDQIVKALLDRNGSTTTSQPAPAPPSQLPLPTSSTVAEAISIVADPATAALKLTVVAKTDATPDAPAKTPKAEIAAPQPVATQPETPDTQQQPPASTTAPAPAPSLARTVQAAYQPLSAPGAALPQLAFEMVRQYHQGQSRFTIRLDPPELGRVDVKMHVDASGTLNARLTVERSETLDMFQRDQKTLERALAQAGLDSQKTNLEFALKQNPFSMSGQQGQGGNPYNGGFNPGLRAGADDDATALPAITLYRGTVSAGGVNIFV